MLAASPVFGFLNYFLRMSNVGMVMHAVTLTREEEPRVRSKLRKLSRAAIQHSRELNGSSLIVSRQFPQRSTVTSRSRSRGIAHPSRSIRYQLLGNRSGIRFACASEQNDAEQTRDNRGDRRDPDNEAGIGVPW